MERYLTRVTGGLVYEVLSCFIIYHKIIRRYANNLEAFIKLLKQLFLET